MSYNNNNNKITFQSDSTSSSSFPRWMKKSDHMKNSESPSFLRPDGPEDLIESIHIFGCNVDMNRAVQYVSNSPPPIATPEDEISSSSLSSKSNLLVFSSSNQIVFSRRHEDAWIQSHVSCHSSLSPVTCLQVSEDKRMLVSGGQHSRNNVEHRVVHTMSILSTPRQQTCRPHKITKNVPALTSKEQISCPHRFAPCPEVI